jgi:hypothetical protein
MASGPAKHIDQESEIGDTIQAYQSCKKEKEFGFRE